jgi:UDP-N-acetylmuramate--alanine ligase
VDLNNIHNVYFVGIGGIGMSALARYFHESGKQVAGYDKTPTKITTNLEKLGISIHFKDSVVLVPDDFKNKSNTLVIYTPAVKVSHEELQYFKTNNFFIQKRAEVLGLITKKHILFCSSWNSW